MNKSISVEQRERQGFHNTRRRCDNREAWPVYNVAIWSWARTQSQARSLHIERFLVSSREFCPAYRRGHWRFAVWVICYCASVFARACSVLLFTCLHTYTSYKWSAWAMFNMVITETTRCRYTHFVPRTLMKLYQFWEKVLVLHLFPGVWGF